MTPTAVFRALALAIAVLALAAGGRLSAAELVAPSSLTASPSSSSTIGLTWVEVNASETGHSIERSGNPSSGFVVVGSTGKNVTSFQDAGLAAGTAYYYRVRATGRRGVVSAYSAVAAASTPLAGSTLPAAPSGLSAAAASSTQVNLLWTDNSTNETAFKVERGASSTGPWTQVATTAAASYADAGLAGETTYFYRVRAYNGVGDSAYTNTASSTTPAAAGGGTGSHVWSNGFGGLSASASAVALGLAVDGLGEIAVTGYIMNSVDVGSGLLTSAGASDIFVAKYSAAGVPLWSRRIGSTLDDRGKAIAVDRGGNVYVTGLFRGTVDFGGGAVSAAPYAANAFLAKYSPQGVHLWSKRLSTAAGLDEATAIDVDAADNVVVAGVLYQTSDFGGGPLTSAGGADVFLVRLSSAGAHLWSRRMGGAAEDWATAVAVDAVGNPCIGGYFSGSADIGGALTSAGLRDVFVARFSAAGAPVWSRRFGGASDDLARGVAVDGAGNVVVTGNFRSASMSVGGTVLGNLAGADIFLARIGADGLPLWARQFGAGLSLDERALAVSVDGSGNILLTGSVVDAIDLGGGLLASDGWYDIFVAKYSVGGAHTWSKRTGAGSGQAIAADGNGNVIGTGDFSGSTPVNFGGANLESPGGTDMFLVKLSP